MAKARALLDAEIARQNGVNRSNCDYLLHALQKVGFQEEDVEPLRKDIEVAKLGKGYVRFMLETEDLIACEPKLDTSKLAPIMLEAWNGIYEMKKMHVTRATKKKQVEQEKDDKSPAYNEAVKEEQEALAIFSKVNVEFSRYRALNHVCLGTYKPKPDEAFLADGMEVLEACKEMDMEKLELLMNNKKYTANEYDKQNGATPLHWACWNKSEEMVTKLIECKANVNAKTLRGFTALHFAYQQHSDPIVKMLLAARADPTAKSAMGQAPGGKNSGLGSEMEILKPYY